MACPRGYRGRHTGLYRDTEGKQPAAGNLRTKFQAAESARRAAHHGCAAVWPARAGYGLACTAQRQDRSQ